MSAYEQVFGCSSVFLTEPATDDENIYIKVICVRPGGLTAGGVVRQISRKLLLLGECSFGHNCGALNKVAWVICGV